jgi:DNA end-binding protein Ku
MGRFATPAGMERDMAARAMWKGVIRIGGESIPVKMYSAVEDHDVHFHLLHDKDLVRVKQRVVNPETHAEVPQAAIQKGYPVDAGSYVIVTPEEVAETAPEPSRDIEVTRCVPWAAVPEAWYARPYYLGPDGSSEAYFAFAQALREEGRAGIARWVMRGKPYQGALRAHGDHLVLISLHHAGEVVDLRELEAPRGREFDKRELQLAEQLVSALAGDFDARAFHDEHRARVLALIEQKAKGKPTRARRIKPLRRAEPEKLTTALAASLASVRKERKSA